MKNSRTYRSVLSIVVCFGLLLVLVLLLPWKSINGNVDGPTPLVSGYRTTPVVDSTTVADKQKGAHVFSIEDSTDLQLVRQYNLEWVTMVSWAFQDDYDSPDVVHHNGDSLYMQRYDSSWVQRIKLVREGGFKVFFKPHLWINDVSEGKWRSDIFPSNDENWDTWQEGYRNFIIRYAKVAAASNADMFCIGTEFSRLSVEKPEFWQNLIQEIRTIYSGKLTYAANWYNEFENITFWDQLDYIGVQAYFPLAKTECPSVEQISIGWNRHFPVLKSTHEKYNRKILFTEIGYRSSARSAINPWQWSEDASQQENPFSAETQANCYEAFFNTVWEKDWFAGVHIWQLINDFKDKREKYHLDFTPQGKPAQAIIAKGFE